jgi:hypothetical protein
MRPMRQRERRTSIREDRKARPSICWTGFLFGTPLDRSVCRAMLFSYFKKTTFFSIVSIYFSEIQLERA